MDIETSWLRPNWNTPKNVKALCTTRLSPSDEKSQDNGYDNFNLALHVGDSEETVRTNRLVLAQALNLSPSDFCWLNQVHGNTIVKADEPRTKVPDADACYTDQSNIVCTVMTADCLPVLLCDSEGTQVAAIHAGWRSLAAGIISLTLKHFSDPSKVFAWLGPAISHKAFEVGEEVRQEFIDSNPTNITAFTPSTFTSLDNKNPKWMADLYSLAKIELERNGVLNVSGGEHCTYSESNLLYSYRRDGAISGRMASIIWLDS